MPTPPPPGLLDDARARGWTLTAHGDTWQVQGRGPRVAGVPADLARALAADAACPVALADWCAFCRGLTLAWAEPARGRADGWDFAACARCMLPMAGRPALVDGVRAGGVEPFWVPWGEGLVWAFLVELDQGEQWLTRAMVEGWGAAADRVERAATSLLLHRTDWEAWQPLEGLAGARRMRVGDGFDAARANLVEAIAWDEVTAGCWIAMPRTDELWVGRGSATDPAVVAAVHAAFVAADEPLSPRVHAWQKGRLVAAPTLNG
jgi:hypothetical protein